MARSGPPIPTIWGSASNEAVKMIYDDQDWAIFGSISSESTHIMLRVALRAEIPIVNSASTDPTIPETYIPWYFTDLQDDRVQSFTLARRIYTELGLKRVGISAREQPLWPDGRSQVPRCLAAAGPSRGHRAEVSCPATRTSRGSCGSSAGRAPTPSCCGPTKRRRRQFSSRCAPWA